MGDRLDHNIPFDFMQAKSRLGAGWQLRRLPLRALAMCYATIRSPHAFVAPGATWEAFKDQEGKVYGAKSDKQPVYQVRFYGP